MLDGIGLAVLALCVVLLAVLAHSLPLTIIAAIIAGLAGMAFHVWLFVGQTRWFLQIARGEPAPFSDVFSGGPYFLNSLLACILVGVIVEVGFLLFVVPGVILALMLSQFLYAIVDRNMGAMDSLRFSKNVTTGNKLTLFLIGLLAQIGGDGREPRLWFGLDRGDSFPGVVARRDLSSDDGPTDRGPTGGDSTDNRSTGRCSGESRQHRRSPAHKMPPPTKEPEFPFE